jgi:general secretion pathway protein G
VDSVPKDPWGNEYVYQAPGQNGDDYFIASYGADGKEGGSGDDADITSVQGGEDKSK